jgi:hypothetical protein
MVSQVHALHLSALFTFASGRATHERRLPPHSGHSIGVM